VVESQVLYRYVYMVTSDRVSGIVQISGDKWCRVSVVILTLFQDSWETERNSELGPEIN
jgi:hypothetical protein